MGSNKKSRKAKQRLEQSKELTDKELIITILEYLIMVWVIVGIITGVQILFGIFAPIKEEVRDLSEYEKQPYDRPMSIIARDLKMHISDEGTYSITDEITFKYHRDVATTLDYKMPVYAKAYYEDLDIELLPGKLTLIQNGTEKSSYVSKPDGFGLYEHLNEGNKGDIITYKWEIEGNYGDYKINQLDRMSIFFRQGFDYKTLTDGTRNCDFSVEIMLDSPITKESVYWKNPVYFFDELKLELSDDGKILKGRNKEFSYRRHYLPQGQSTRKDYLILQLYIQDQAPTDHNPRTTIKENKAFMKTLRLPIWVLIVYLTSLALRGGIIKKQKQREGNYYIIPLNIVPIFIIARAFILIGEMQQQAYLLGDGDALHDAYYTIFYTVLGIVFGCVGGILVNKDSKLLNFIGIPFCFIAGAILLVGAYLFFFQSYTLETWFVNAIYFLLMSIYISFFIRVPKIYIPRGQR